MVRMPPAQLNYVPCRRAHLLVCCGPDARGDCALICATRANCQEAVSLILDRGANPDMDNEEQETALTVAAKADHVPLLQLLLEKKANPNIVTCPEQMCAAHYAGELTHPIP